jgi:hypothetical protein
MAAGRHAVQRASYQYLAANILLDPGLADAAALRRLGITGDRGGMCCRRRT